MKPIPEIVREFVFETQGRMPETEQEVNDYLDLINHSKEYANAFEMERLNGGRVLTNGLSLACGRVDSELKPSCCPHGPSVAANV